MGIGRSIGVCPAGNVDVATLLGRWGGLSRLSGAQHHVQSASTEAGCSARPAPRAVFARAAVRSLGIIAPVLPTNTGRVRVLIRDPGVALQNLPA